MGTHGPFRAIGSLCRLISGRKLTRTLFTMTITALVLGFTTTSVARAYSTAGSQACSSGGGSVKSETSCAIMPAAGAFRVSIPGTPAVLIGTGTPDRAGKPIQITRVPLLCPQLGGFGIRISTPRTAGLLPPLRWATGTLYARNATTGTCSVVTSPALAAAPGVYQVVAGTPSGVTRMPKTGGGAPVLPLPLERVALLFGSIVVMLLGFLFRRYGTVTLD